MTNQHVLMNHLGGMALIGSSSVFMVGNAAQDTEKRLVSLFGSFRVQPCANNEMGGWLNSVGCGNSNPRIQRCRYCRLDRCASGLGSYFPNGSFLDFSLSSPNMRVVVRAGLAKSHG